MTYEDFTSYTEVDPDDYIQKTANHIDAVLWRNKSLTAVYKDFGAGHFGNYEHLIDARCEVANNYGVGIFWSVSNSNSTVFVDDSLGTIAVDFYRAGAGTYWVYLLERYGGIIYGTQQAVSANTYYYFRIQKNGTAMTVKIYSTAALRDAGGTPDVGTLTLTLHSDYTHQYLYAARNYENKSTEPESSTIDVDNLNLQEGAVLKEVKESISLAESILRDKTLAISDSVGVADVLLANKTFLVSDSVTLSELIEVISGAIIKYVADAIGLSDTVKIDKSLIVSDALNLLDQVFRHKPQLSITDVFAITEVVVTSKLFSVADQISLSDVAYALKQLRISDSISLADAVSTPQRAIQISEAIGLTDDAYVNKLLMITDEIALAEVVEKGVAGAVKTRIFLVLGDLAVQLSG
jgi:hypothetical protein